MATRIQVTIDCAEPARLVRFWAAALHYEVQCPPDGFDSWSAFWRSIGLPEDEVEDGGDSIVDPDSMGPRLWFQKVPEAKVAKNRVHLDLDVSGGRSVPLDLRRERVVTGSQRLVGEGATQRRVLEVDGMDYFGIVMQDPEGNEFCLH